MTRVSKDETYFDIHFHANARPEMGGDLPRVAKWMEENRVEQLIVLQFRQTLPRNEEEAARIIENFKPYRGSIHRFGVLPPDDVSNIEAAVTALEAMKNEGR